MTSESGHNSQKSRRRGEKYFSLRNLVKPKYWFNPNRMIFEGSMGLNLLVEKRLRGQRLGNVRLNIDENIQNTDFFYKIRP